MADEDEGDVEEGETVYVAVVEAEEVDLSCLDKEAEGGFEGWQNVRQGRGFYGSVSV